MADPRSNFEDKMKSLLKQVSAITPPELAQTKQALESFTESINNDKTAEAKEKFTKFLNNEEIPVTVRNVIFLVLEIDSELHQQNIEKAQSKKKSEKEEERLRKIHEEKDFTQLKVIGAQEKINAWLAALPNTKREYSLKILAKISLLASWFNEKSQGLDQAINELIGVFLQFENVLQEKTEDLMWSKKDKDFIEGNKAKKKLLGDREMGLIEQLAKTKQRNDPEASDELIRIKTDIQSLRKQQTELDDQITERIEKLKQPYNKTYEALQKEIDKNLSHEAKGFSLSSLFSKSPKDAHSEEKKLHRTSSTKGLTK